MSYLRCTCFSKLKIKNIGFFSSVLKNDLQSETLDSIFFQLSKNGRTYPSAIKIEIKFIYMWIIQEVKIRIWYNRFSFTWPIAIANITLRTKPISLSFFQAKNRMIRKSKGYI